MATTYYETVNGQIVAEYTAGVATEYVHDALGSVIATTDASRNVQNTYRWAGYGTQIAKTGTAADPKFLWNGTSGYRATGRAHASHYVRRRHFTLESAIWTTCDPVWPRQPLYVYADLSPTTYLDATGMLCCRNIRKWKNENACMAPNPDGAVAVYIIEWNLDKADAAILGKYDGWLVQHVVFNYAPIACCLPNGAVTRPSCQPADEYWEAWYLRKSSKGWSVEYYSDADNRGKCDLTTVFQDQDRMSFPVMPRCSLAKDKQSPISISGHARVYSSQDTAVNPGSWPIAGLGMCPSCLHATTVFPNWSDVGALAHGMSANYACCCPNESPPPVFCQGDPANGIPNTVCGSAQPFLNVQFTGGCKDKC